MSGYIFFRLSKFIVYLNLFRDIFKEIKLPVAVWIVELGVCIKCSCDRC